MIEDSYVFLVCLDSHFYAQIPGSLVGYDGIMVPIIGNSLRACKSLFMKIVACPGLNAWSAPMGQVSFVQIDSSAHLRILRLLQVLRKLL